MTLLKSNMPYSPCWSVSIRLRKMTAQVVRHSRRRSRSKPAHMPKEAADLRQYQLGPSNEHPQAASNEHPQAASQPSLSASSLSRGLGMQASGPGFASNKATTAQIMNARSTGLSMRAQSLGSAPRTDPASTVNSLTAGHRQPGGIR